jgi:hypothetical protein
VLEPLRRGKLGRPDLSSRPARTALRPSRLATAEAALDAASLRRPSPARWSAAQGHTPLLQATVRIADAASDHGQVTGGYRAGAGGPAGAGEHRLCAWRALPGELLCQSALLASRATRGAVWAIWAGRPPVVSTRSRSPSPVPTAAAWVWPHRRHQVAMCVLTIRAGGRYGETGRSRREGGEQVAVGPRHQRRPRRVPAPRRGDQILVPIHL